jgi:hypothetical protein
MYIRVLSSVFGAVARCCDMAAGLEGHYVSGCDTVIDSRELPEAARAMAAV